MGDVGSAFLGFTFAALAVAAAQRDTRLALAGILLVWPFVFDATFTFLRRLMQRRECLCRASLPSVPATGHCRLQPSKVDSCCTLGLAAWGAIPGDCLELRLSWAADLPSLLSIPLLCLALWVCCQSRRVRRPGARHEVTVMRCDCATVIFLLLICSCCCWRPISVTRCAWRRSFGRLICPALFSSPALALVIVPVTFRWTGVYSRYWRYASVEELLLLAGSLTIAVVLTAALSSAITLWVPGAPNVPRSIPFIFLLLALVATAGPRLLVRLSARSTDHKAIRRQGESFAVATGADHGRGRCRRHDRARAQE